ncbi:MAG: OmpA family protein [Bacteroidota bacterium]
MKRPLLFFFASIIYTLAIGQEQEPQLQKSIYFGGGSYYIDDQQIVELEEWIKSIPNLEQYEINVFSHTDNIGGVEYNQWLSKMRSQAAVLQLILLDIPDEMIFIKDFGLHNPNFSNNTWEGRQRNRRVDIILAPLTL